MPVHLAKAPTAPRAFIAWENKRETRYELISGEVRLMAGASRAHDLVAGDGIRIFQKASRLVMIAKNSEFQVRNRLPVVRRPATG